MNKKDKLQLIKEDFGLKESEMCSITNTSRTAIRSYLEGATEPNDSKMSQMVNDLLNTKPKKVGPFNKRCLAIFENSNFRSVSKRDGKYDHSNVVCKYIEDMGNFIKELVPSEYVVEFSLGKGKLSDVYWISVMEANGCPKLSTTEGRYVSILFDSTFETLSVCIMAGTSEYSNKTDIIENAIAEEREFFTEFLLENINYNSLGFQVGDVILNANTTRAKAYEKAVLVSRTLEHYSTNKEELEKTVVDALNLYEIYMQKYYIPEILEGRLVSLIETDTLANHNEGANENQLPEAEERTGINVEEYQRLRALIDENKKIIGNYTEEFAFNEATNNKLEDEKVEWISKETDGKGFDIKISNVNDEVVALKEIKGTSKRNIRNSVTVFITRTELMVAKANPNLHCFTIYFNVSKDKLTNEISATKFGEFKLYEDVILTSYNNDDETVTIEHEDYKVILYLASCEAKFIKNTI